jgi:glycosyltransferase involved in cell wall biosynthesis
MKILFLTIGNEIVASTRARVYGYLPFLAEEGAQYKLISFTSRGKCKRILNLMKDNLFQYLFELCYKIVVILKLFLYSKRYNVIFVQKVILPKTIWSILKALNKNIVFDFDDAIYLHRDIEYILKDAASVITSNIKLHGFVSKSVSGYNKRNVHYLMSPVSVNNQVLPAREDSVTLGWIGSPETSRYLYTVLPVLKELKNKFQNLSIEFMGADREERLESLGANIREWSIEGQEKCLENMDIGIMPLENDEWSWAKAGYKLLLYMSKGIPCVASPVGVNNDLITNGETGYLAETREEWSDRLSLMIKDASLRRKMGEKGRERAEKYYSYKVCGPIMLKILKGVKGA